MNKLKIIVITLLVYPFISFGQACGAGKYTIKVFTTNVQKELKYQLYNISRKKVDSIAKYKVGLKNWTKSEKLGKGIIAHPTFADFIKESSNKNLLKSVVENNIIKILTPELKKGLILLEIIDGKKSISVITYAGDCGKYKNALIWNDSPEIIPIDYRIDLETLELDNFPLIVNSNEFVINGINCKWQYLVQPLVKDKNQVDIISQNLISIKANKVLFASSNTVDNNNSHDYPTTLERLRKYDSFNLNCNDINKDNFCDFLVVTERAGAGANVSHSIYLFNPDKKIFEYSEIFSGTNTEYDSNKNRVTGFGKSGVDNYYYRFINLKPNKKDIDFIETVHHCGDTIFYIKLIEDRVITEKKVVLEEYENFLDHLERK